MQKRVPEHAAESALNQVSFIDEFYSLDITPDVWRDRLALPGHWQALLECADRLPDRRFQVVQASISPQQRVPTAAHLGLLCQAGVKTCITARGKDRGAAYEVATSSTFPELGDCFGQSVEA
jgi:hypothetical protein